MSLGTLHASSSGNEMEQPMESGIRQMTSTLVLPFSFVDSFKLEGAQLSVKVVTTSQDVALTGYRLGTKYLDLADAKGGKTPKAQSKVANVVDTIKKVLRDLYEKTEVTDKFSEFGFTPTDAFQPAHNDLLNPAHHSGHNFLMVNPLYAEGAQVVIVTEN